MYEKKSNIVILADGEFPTHAIPLQALESADAIVCCDGAAGKLCAYGKTPDYIAGDLDSLPDELKTRFAGRLYCVASRETNDLTKAVDFCLQRGAAQLKILGAGGLREDHTIANVSLLADYAAKCHVEMITNYGTFVIISKTSTLESAAGQQVSIFSLTPSAKISSTGLKYPLRRQCLDSWWKGSLNEATGARFTLSFNKGIFIVFRTHAGNYEL
ncbi:MAG: thiamine diphosphokinase [Prevotellaceae bacterium]|jgi:thiamine pyrophosphokinase|nr:thiamine diphosphokinase [Prevotellaceae bacterium]